MSCAVFCDACGVDHCPECHTDVGPEGFEVVEITTEMDSEYHQTRWKQRCWECGYHHAFIGGPRTDEKLSSI